MFRIEINSISEMLGFAMVVVGSLVVSVLANAMQNEFWASPLIGLALMFLFGEMPSLGKKTWFMFFFGILIIGSFFLLIFTKEQVYWTTPILLGVLVNLFALGEIDFKISTDSRKRKAKQDYFEEE
jgi:apolipoprotein N-acyltransferase